MSFIDILTKQESKKDDIIIENKKIIKENKDESPEEILRSSGFKIRLVTPTSFGTQIDFAKQYDEAEIEKALEDFSIKIKGKSVFVID